MELFWILVRIALWTLAGFAAARIMKTELPLLWTVLLGWAGGLVGSLIAHLVGIRSWNSVAGLVISVAGACLVIWGARKIIPLIKIK